MTAVTAPVLPASLDGRAPARIAAMARAYVDMLGHPATDPRHILGELAVEVARKVDEGGAQAASIRELRVLLSQLAETPNGPSGFVDELRVRHAQQQFDALLAVRAA